METCISCHKETKGDSLVRNFWNEPLCVKCDKEIVDDLKKKDKRTLTQIEMSVLLNKVVTYLHNNIDDCKSDSEESPLVKVRMDTLYEVLEKIHEEAESILDDDE